MKCGGCKKDLPEENFYVKYKDRIPVKRTDWSGRCKPCQREWAKRNYFENRVQINSRGKERRYENYEHYQQLEADRRLKKVEHDEARKARMLERRRVSALDVHARYIHDRVKNWRHGAKTRGFEFRITVEDVVKLLEKQGGKCFYSGVELAFEPNKNNTLSLDRIDSQKGYTIENVVLCQTAVNLMKLDLTLEEFKELVLMLAQRFQN